MMSEGFFLCFLFLILSQNSSLWASLFIVFLSVFLVFLLMNFYVALVMYLYVMVFISGLLIFLITVASLVNQGQGFSLVVSFFSLVALFVLYHVVIGFGWFKVSTEAFVVWFSCEGGVMLFILSVLVVVLVVMSTFFLSFKGLVRSV